MTIAQIGDELQRVANGYIYNSVVDGTGLNGSYDFTLSFSSADKILPTAGDAANSTDPNGALSVFDAVSRQLGLKLEKTKRPYPVLVIDHIEETPTLLPRTRGLSACHIGSPQGPVIVSEAKCCY